MTLIVDYGGEKKFLYYFLKFFSRSLNLHFTISHNDIIQAGRKGIEKERGEVKVHDHNQTAFSGFNIDVFFTSCT